MNRTSSFSRNHPYAKTRGWVSPKRAASSLPTITDGTNEVDDASEIWILGGTVSEPEEGVAQISFGGQAIGSNSSGGGFPGGSGGGTTSGALPVRMYNNSGLVLIPGDVVVTDPTQDSAVTTTATASNTRIAGVVQAPINVGEWGPVLFNGFTSIINTVSAVTRGDYALTSSTPKAAGSTAARVAGSFAVYTTGAGDFPNFVTASADTAQETPVETLTIAMPAAIPANRILFLALWLESGATSIDVDGWTLIGAETGFTYYYKVSAGDDTATATWTGASVATATVLLLDENVSTAVPIEAHDYDTSTSAATVSGMTTAPARYAIAGVPNSVTPGSGYVRLGGDSAAFISTGGAPALVQFKEGDKSGVTFDNPVSNGNVMVAVPTKLNDNDVWETDPRLGGVCPVDTGMVQMARGVDTDTEPGERNGNNAIGIQAKVIGDGYSGPFNTNGACDSGLSRMLLMEFENLNVSDYEVETLEGGTAGTVDLGIFTVDPTDVVVMAVVWKGEIDPVISVNGFTQLQDGKHPDGYWWWWVGYKIGAGDASVTQGASGQTYAAAAVKLTQGNQSAAGTLAGKYIGHASSATSPFTGGGAQNDAIFAFNLLQDAKASALLYGPDLSTGGTFSGDASDVPFTPAGTIAATDVQSALEEVAAEASGSSIWFNATTYGAVGDGTTDDTDAIQDAIAAAGAAGGGVVYLPAGDYLISAETSGQRYGIVLDEDNVVLQGDGMFATTLTFDAAQTLPSGSLFHPIEIGTATTGVTGVTIRDLGVIANHSALEAGGTEFINGIWACHSTTTSAHSDDITIERVRLVDANAGIGCNKGGTTGSARTASRHQRWSVRDCLVDTTTNKAIELGEAQDSEIVGCVTENTQDGAQAINFSARIRISGNRLKYVDGGVNVTEGCVDIEVSDNILTAITGTPVGFNGGIVLRRESFATAGDTSSRVMIVDNIIQDTVSADKIGIRFASYTANTGVGVFEDYVIARNVVRAVTNYLYDEQFPAKTSATRLRVFDNYFSGAVATSGSWSSTRTRLERNHITSNFTLNANDWDLRGNVFGGTVTLSGTGYTLDNGYVRSVLVSATPPSSGQVLTASSATAAAWAAPSAGATDLDDLTDVVITSPAEDEHLQYVGGQWVNNARRWEPVTFNFGSGPELVWDGDDLVMEWKDY